MWKTLILRPINLIAYIKGGLTKAVGKERVHHIIDLAAPSAVSTDSDVDTPTPCLYLRQRIDS